MLRIPPALLREICAARPNLAPPDRAHSRRLRRAHLRPCSKLVTNTNELVFRGFSVPGTGQRNRMARLRLPASAFGVSPREREHAVWASWSGQVSSFQKVYVCEELAAHDSCRRYPPACEPSQIIIIIMQIDEQSESRKRTRARTGLPKPTNSRPRVLAQHPTLAAWVGVPELVTNCCSDGLSGPIASDEALPSGLWASRRVETSQCIDMSRVLTESDLKKLENSSILCIH
jgi:hypothetical protein